MLQSTVVFQSGYQRQGGKENDRKRDGLGEREKDITRGDRNGPVPLWSPYKSIL